MASSTPNLGLTLPVGGEHVSRQIINANNVKIDEAVGPVPSGTDLQSQVTALNNNSVSKKTEIPANSNVNNYTENGIYTIGAGNSSSISNLATTGASELVVFTSTAYTVQTQYVLGDGSVPIQSYQRYFRNNTWSSWARLALKSDLNDKLSEYTYRMSGAEFPTESEIKAALQSINKAGSFVVTFGRNSDNEARTAMFYCAASANYGAGIIVSYYNNSWWKVKTSNGIVTLTQI